MAASRVFIVNVQGETLLITPLRNISSLAEDEVQEQWEDIKSKVEQREVKDIVFDFEKVNYFGSSMLEAMLYLWKQVSPSNGRVVVCNVSETAHEILRVSKFDTLWPIYDSQQQALTELSS